MAAKKNTDTEATAVAMPETASATVEHKFTKDKLIGSKKFANRRDVLNAVLEDGREYTIAETDKLIEDFMKGEVK